MSPSNPFLGQRSEVKRERLAVVRCENALLERGLQSAQGCHI